MVATSDLGSDALRRGGSSPFIRTKEPFRRAPFSLPVRRKKRKTDCISSFCKGFDRFPEPEAESSLRQTRGSTKGNGAENRAARRGLLPNAFAMRCFAAFYVVINLSCGRFVNPQKFNVMRQETFAILFLMRKGRPKKNGLASFTPASPRAVCDRSSTSIARAGPNCGTRRRSA